MADHSKLPWSIKSFDKIADADGDHLLLTGVRMPMTAGIRLDEARANAAFIVRAVNCHDELVEALDSLNRLVTDAQDKLCAYLHPDSSIDDAQLANLMLEHFDGTRQREVQKAARDAIAKARGEMP